MKSKDNYGFVKTKVIATIGPASREKAQLKRLMKAGMSVARLNFSHGSYDDHLKVIKNIREISAAENWPVAILQDLCGPKIRLAELAEPVELEKGALITLSTDPAAPAELFTEFKKLPQYVREGEAILLDDGYIELEVVSVERKTIKCRVIVPGLAKSKKGINLPDLSDSIPVFTAKDRADLIFGLENDVDYVAMSFVDAPGNVNPIKKMMLKMGKNIPVIAKIERPAALQNVEAIIEAFDGIMVARGDLGVEVAPEKVPLIQKDLIRKANDKNKIVITATQMLESMINNPRPTRAESSDVSNAILDGSDCVMLSGETAVGAYPCEAIKMMKRIAGMTENADIYPYTGYRDKIALDHTEAIVKSAAEIAADLDVAAIMVFTYSGETAKVLSQYRPQCPIFAFSPQKKVVQQMAAYWGVIPFYLEYNNHVEDLIFKGEKLLKLNKAIRRKDVVIHVAGNTATPGATNMLRISKIG